MIIKDNRRLRIHRVVSINGSLGLDQGVEIWQLPDGGIRGVGLWYDLLVPNIEDLQAQARASNISPLEWLKRKLELITFLRVEVVGYFSSD